MISIIIPAYNPGRFIYRALDSIFNQTYQNFEVILINDGGTLDVRVFDRRLKIHTRDHYGPGASRNYGISVAQGNLISFMDADDYILPHALQVLHDAYENHKTPITAGGGFRQSPDGKIIKVFPPCQYSGVLGYKQISDCIKEYVETNDVYLVSHCWGRLYEKDFLCGHKLYFNETMKIGEDGEFNCRILKCVAEVYTINEPLYAFQQHNASFSKSPINAVSVYNDYGTFLKTLCSDCLHIGKNYSFIANVIIAHIIRTAHCSHWLEVKNILQLDMVKLVLEYYKPEGNQDKLIPWLMKLKLARLLLWYCKRKSPEEKVPQNYKMLTRKDLLLHELKGKFVLIYGADVVGRKILKVLKENGIGINGFIDRNEDLQGTLIDGVRVFEAFPLLSNEIVVVSVMSVHNILPFIKDAKWYLGSVLLDEDTRQLTYEIDDTKYQIESCKIAHSAFERGITFLRSLDVMITEKCSLKCRDCSNLMQYFEKPKNYATAKIIWSARCLLRYVDEIMEARVLGGDAFMHPGWVDVVEYLLKVDEIKRVIVYTNGIIVPKDISVLQNPKALVYMTDYPWLSMNIEKLQKMFMEFGVFYKIIKVDHWIDCASIAKHYYREDRLKDIFNECVANNLTTMVEGKLFRCPYAASAYKLGVPMESCDYLDVTDLSKSNTEEGIGKTMVDQYIHRKAPMTICDYCKSRILTNKILPAIQADKPLKWRISQKGD